MRSVALIGERGLELRVHVPETRKERRRGLLGRRRLSPDEGVLLIRCKSVHTIGMRFPIAVAFLDRDLRVLRVRLIPPGRVALPRLGVRHVLEVTPSSDLKRGDRFVVQANGLGAVTSTDILLRLPSTGDGPGPHRLEA